MTLEQRYLRSFITTLVSCLLIACSSPQPALLSWRTDTPWWQQAAQEQAYLLHPSGQKIKVSPPTARTILRIQSALENHVKRSFELVVSSLPEANAYALWTPETPQILITTGLLEQWGDDDEALAYAIAHELAHHVLDHTHKAGTPLSSDPSPASTLSQGLSWVVPLPGFIASSSQSWWHSQLNQDMENAADQLALQWLKALGYPSCGAQRLLRSWATNPENSANLIWTYHPHPLDRAQRLASQCAPPVTTR